LSKRPSPLKEIPLRVPGQSLQDEIDRLSSDEMTTYVTYAAAAFGFIMYEWVRWLLNPPPNPWLVTVVGGAVIAYSIRRLVKGKERLRLLKMGRDGERAVAEALDKLRGKGALVLHDIVTGRFNIDHVVLAKRGIYAVETKTYTKRPGAEITYDGATLLVGGWKPPRDPLSQAVAIADWLGRMLKETTGKHYFVRPVVVFPGWYVRNQGSAAKSGTWVLNPEQLPAIIAEQEATISEEDVRAALYFLTRYVKSQPDAA